MERSIVPPSLWMAQARTLVCRVDVVRSASKKFFSYVDGRALADCVEVGVDPTLGDLAADFLEMQQEIHAGVELARHAQPSHLTLRFYPVNLDTLVLVGVELALIDEIGDERNRPHSAHQRLIEGQPVEPVHDLARRGRYA